MPDSNQGPLLWKSGALPMSPKIRDRARARAGGGRSAKKDDEEDGSTTQD